MTKASGSSGQVPSCFELLVSILLSFPSPDPSYWQSKWPSHPVSLLEFKVFSHPLIFNWLPDHTTAYPDHTNPEYLLARPGFSGPVLLGGHLSPGMSKSLVPSQPIILFSTQCSRQQLVTCKSQHFSHQLIIQLSLDKPSPR